jgi:hypothetical protein
MDIQPGQWLILVGRQIPKFEDQFDRLLFPNGTTMYKKYVVEKPYRSISYFMDLYGDI